MKSKILQIVCIFFCLVLNMGTANAQNSTVSMGGTVIGSDGTISYSIGQIAVQIVSDGTFTVSEGVQQPYEIMVIGVDAYPNITLCAKLYPNPTSGLVVLAVEGMELSSEKIEGNLMDLQGKILKQLIINEENTTLDISDMPAGTYMLTLRQKGELLKTFKIVKLR